MSAPLIFLPGWGLGRGPWQPTVDALGGQIIDLPGYGQAPKAADFQVATDYLAETLPPDAILCGWSLGAMLALAIAAQAPQRVAKLVLVGGTLSFVQRPGWPHGMAPETLAEFTAAVAADFSTLLPRFVGNFNRGDERVRAVTREILDRADPFPEDDALAAGLAWLRDTDLRTVAPEVRTPTLVLHGAHDPLMPAEAAEATAAAIPGARLSMVPGCAHAPFISAPEVFRAQLASFIHESTP